MLAILVGRFHIGEVSDDNLYPKPDSHNTARHWVAEKRGEYVTQAELRDQAKIIGVDHLFSAAKGIYKPAGSEYVFSIRHEPTGKYVDRDLDLTGAIWSMVYAAETYSHTGAYAPSSTSALQKCIEDKMPIAVFWRHEVGQPYEILGLGLPLDFSDGAFLVAGTYDQISAVAQHEISIPGSVLYDLAQTDTPTMALRRLEQHQLRERLLQGNAVGCCRLCGIEIPAALLIASHIKPRNLCSQEERMNSNVATLMCSLGCDSLYERGHLRIRDDGAIYRINTSGSEDLKSYMKRYEGRYVTFNSEAEREFFRFHRELVFSA